MNEQYVRVARHLLREHGKERVSLVNLSATVEECEVVAYELLVGACLVASLGEKSFE